MTKEEAIKFLQQIYPNGGCSWLDEQRIEAINMAIEALKEDPVSDDMVEELEIYQRKHFRPNRKRFNMVYLINLVSHFCNWQVEQMRKGAHVIGAKSVEFKLGSDFSFSAKCFDREKAKSFCAKEGDTVIAYFFKKAED